MGCFWSRWSGRAADWRDWQGRYWVSKWFAERTGPDGVFRLRDRWNHLSNKQTYCDYHQQQRERVARCISAPLFFPFYCIFLLFVSFQCFSPHFSSFLCIFLYFSGFLCIFLRITFKVLRQLYVAYCCPINAFFLLLKKQKRKDKYLNWQFLHEVLML